MAILEDVERRVLANVDEEFSHIQHSLEDAARSGALDDLAFRRLADTASELARRVNSELPPRIDPRATDEIRRRLVDIVTLRRDGPSLDIADSFLMEMEAVRHIIRDLVQEQPPVSTRDGGAVIRLLEEWLPRLSVAHLSELLNYSPRQVQRLRREGGQASHRAEIVARLVAILRHGWTDEGVAAWFYRPRRDLGDAKPIDLLDDASHEGELFAAARSGRVQGGV